MTKNNDDEQVILEFGVQTFTLTDYTRYQEMVAHPINQGD